DLRSARLILPEVAQESQTLVPQCMRLALAFIHAEELGPAIGTRRPLDAFRLSFWVEHVLQKAADERLVVARSAALHPRLRETQSPNRIDDLIERETPSALQALTDRRERVLPPVPVHEFLTRASTNQEHPLWMRGPRGDGGKLAARIGGRRPEQIPSP